MLASVVEGEGGCCVWPEAHVPLIADGMGEEVDGEGPICLFSQQNLLSILKITLSRSLKLPVIATH
jgi:hypothetical protein